MKHLFMMLIVLFNWAAYGNQDLDTINLIRVEDPAELRVAISVILFHEIHHSPLIANEHLRKLHEDTRDWSRERRLVWFRNLRTGYTINNLVEFLYPGRIPPRNSFACLEGIPRVESSSSTGFSPQNGPLRHLDAFRNDPYERP